MQQTDMHSGRLAGRCRLTQNQADAGRQQVSKKLRNRPGEIDKMDRNGACTTHNRQSQRQASRQAGRQTQHAHVYAVVDLWMRSFEEMSAVML